METANTGLRFMVIDDDPTNNYICSRYIQIVFPGANIKTFTLPEEGLQAMLSSGGTQGGRTILFLDINMPVLSGWDVLDRFATYPDDVKKQFTIYILSSSISKDDKNKAAGNALVTAFLEKPLSIDRLKEIKQQLS